MSPAEPTDANDTPYTVQVHAFQTQEKAQQMIAYYSQQGLPAFSSLGRRPQEARWWQVFIGRFDARAEAEAFGQAVKEKEKLPAFMVVRMGKATP